MNERYLDGLAQVSTDQPIKTIVDDICFPSELNGNRIRALRPWSFDDNELLKTIGRGEYQIDGFRNKDLRQHLNSEIENANPMLKRKLFRSYDKKNPNFTRSWIGKESSKNTSVYDNRKRKKNYFCNPPISKHFIKASL
jgi:hypothetical protein